MLPTRTHHHHNPQFIAPTRSQPHARVSDKKRPQAAAESSDTRHSDGCPLRPGLPISAGITIFRVYGQGVEESRLGPPIDVRSLLGLERNALVDLLASLDKGEWNAPTPCPGWSVHHLALHLVHDDLRRLSARRERPCWHVAVGQLTG
jgi:Mycothiol maleylpyruvate isomerase N-terminal domain